MSKIGQVSTKRPFDVAVPTLRNPTLHDIFTVYNVFTVFTNNK